MYREPGLVRPRGLVTRLVAALALLIPSLALGASGDSLLPRLSGDQAREAARVIEVFKADRRGPFYRIRWFCRDGSHHPPNPYPCGDRGGGVQHASRKQEAVELAKWNVDVGVVLASLDFESFLDTGRDHALLKQFALEDYLERVDGGWIYRQAYGYRGARQAEDEERAGHSLLARAFADPEWLVQRLFLANTLVGSISHGLPDSAVKRVRDLAKAVAEADAGFQSLRAKIHSAPDRRDIQAVEAYLEERNPPEAVARLIRQLAALMREEGASRRLSARLESMRKTAREGPLGEASRRFAEALKAEDRRRAYRAGADLSFEIAREVGRSTDGERNLDLLDFNAIVQEFGFQAAAPDGELSRLDRLRLLKADLRYAYGAGLLSSRQLDAVQAEIDAVESRRMVAADDYYAALRYLARAADWSRATAVREFGPVSERYGSFEPKARGFVDDLLRGSAALTVSRRLEALLGDAAASAGLEHSVFGAPSNGTVLGLNPGETRGKLLFWDEQSDEPMDQGAIYVIPQSAADLKPMAGILTLDSGNTLSHAQLLAANLGIPNAVIPSSLLPELERRRGRVLDFEVTHKGEVRLAVAEARPSAADSAIAERVRLDTSRLDLAATRLASLRDLDREDSGVTVGPKAANVGQLAKDFPEYVAPGFAVPFGVYLAHIERPLGGDELPLRARIRRALSEVERMKEAGARPFDVAEFIYPELAAIRERIQGMELLPEFARELQEALQREFGADGSYGVFVRSDTNAEDLPQFSGAGLNLTVPNVVSYERIVQAIKDVWASPFAERAFDWRSRILESQEEVYPSVLLMRAVFADKSGVLATVNLDTGFTQDITVNANEGVSAVVEGGAAESLLLRVDGSMKLLQQARSPYRKVCSEEGGFKLLPPIGRDRVLTDGDIEKLRELVAVVEKRYTKATRPDGAALPWDIEFGFEGGELRLFQIRPLVRWQASSDPRVDAVVDLMEAPGE